MNRRNFMRLGSATAGGILLPAGFSAQAQAAEYGLDLNEGARTLDLYRPESGEKLRLEYMVNGKWHANAYSEVCWLLRDIHINKQIAMDYRLIGVLDWTQRYLLQFGYTKPLQILSGYRSAGTNARTEGAAKDSQHLEGRAIDLRIPGVSAEFLGKLFNWLVLGGIGVYTDRNFVHIDTRAKRTAWRGK